MTTLLPRTPSRPQGVRAPRGAALVVLAGMAVGAWWPVLGATLLAVVPAVLVAALLAAGRLRLEVGLLAVVVWVVAALLVAGPPPSSEPLVFCGSWLLAGLVATRRSPIASGLAFVLSALPFAAAVVMDGTDDAPWQGAAVLVATILWLTRSQLRVALAGASTIGLIALLGAHAFAPQNPWLGFGAEQPPGFDQLDPEQTYGPLETRRTGATMLEVTAREPALWRVQVFATFNGQGFRTGPPDLRALPEPRTREVAIKVKVAGLRERRIVSAGQVTGVQAAGTRHRIGGEGTELTPEPARGSTYTVRSAVVDATPAALARVTIPSGAEYEPYTKMYATPVSPAAQAFYGFTRDGRRALLAPPAAVRTIARRLAGERTTELAVVGRVIAYLQDPARFTYTTDVSDVSDEPVVNFLLHTRRGYCQYFAGAAALLLRTAGIPTRVVAGFATGRQVGTGRYRVTDNDAHAWIEVYFPGYGWVPFNPTPPAAAAVVPASLDLFAPAGAAPTRDGGSVLAGAFVLGLGGAGSGWWFVRRRRRVAARRPAAARLADLLAGVVPGPVPPGATLTGLAPQFAAIGPAVSGLADRAERDRFGHGHQGATGVPAVRRPRLELWRALRHDVGALRATVLLVRGR